MCTWYTVTVSCLHLAVRCTCAYAEKEDANTKIQTRNAREHRLDVYTKTHRRQCASLYSLIKWSSNHRISRRTSTTSHQHYNQWRRSKKWRRRERKKNLRISIITRYSEYERKRNFIFASFALHSLQCAWAECSLRTKVNASGSCAMYIFDVPGEVLASAAALAIRILQRLISTCNSSFDIPSSFLSFHDFSFLHAFFIYAFFI